MIDGSLSPTYQQTQLHEDCGVTVFQSLSFELFFGRANVAVFQEVFHANGMEYRRVGGDQVAKKVEVGFWKSSLRGAFGENAFNGLHLLDRSGKKWRADEGQEIVAW